jgi:Subtilase family
MVAGAAANGWGMVGAWPRLKVLSVRALTGGGEPVPASAYRQGVQICVRKKVDSRIAVRAIELAVGGPSTERSAEEVAALADVVDFARRNGLVVVSPAGNDGGAVNVPASISGVLAVSATDPGGALCTFSSRGPEVDLAGLGCEMDVAAAPDGTPAVGQSTSLASAYVGGVATALRSYRPDLDAAQTEALLRSTATPTPGGPMLNAAAAFRAAGLGALVDAYHPPSPAAPQRAARCDRHRRVCSRPRLASVSRHGRRIVIRLKPFSAGLRAVVRVKGRRALRTRSRIIRLRMRRWKDVTIRLSAHGRRPSAALRIRRSALR